MIDLRNKNNFGKYFEFYSEFRKFNVTTITNTNHHQNRKTIAGRVPIAGLEL